MSAINPSPSATTAKITAAESTTEAVWATCTIRYTGPITDGTTYVYLIDTDNKFEGWYWTKSIAEQVLQASLVATQSKLNVLVKLPSTVVNSEILCFHVQSS